MGFSRQKVSKEHYEFNKKISIAETNAYSVMQGFGAHYIIPFGIKLGATDSQVSILSSLPSFLGSLVSLMSGWLMDRVKSRKTLTAIFAMLQAFILIPLFLVPLLTHSILALTIIFCIYSIFEYLISPIWNSLLGDLIPENDRAVYFAKKSQAALIVLLLSMLASGIILNAMTAVNIWLGFWILFTIAILARVLSVIFMLAHYEPAQNKATGKKISFLDFIEHLRGNNFGNFALFKSTFILAVMIASPFFTVYMLKNLGFSYVQYSTVILLELLVRALSSPHWARQVNKYGNRNVMYVSSILISSIPIIWFCIGTFMESSPLIFPIILMSHILIGFAWGGFDLSSYNYMLQTTASENRVRLFSYYNAYFGFFNLIGGIIGALMVYWLAKSPVHSAILGIFLVSAILRLGTALIFIKGVREVKITRKIDEKKMFFDVAIRRPFGSTFHTPLTALHHMETQLEKKTDKDVNLLEDGILRLNKEINNLFKIKNHALHKRGRDVKSKRVSISLKARRLKSNNSSKKR